MAKLRLMIDIRPPMPLPDDTATTRFGQWLAARVGAGDILLLEGDLGAGKTHLARALIQSLLPEPEDVPSPSFTLVQIYDTPEFEIWHSDLYRLTGPEGVEELGLYAAMGEALCLIEWPDRLGTPPREALTIRLSYDGEGRQVALLSDDPRWKDRLADV